MREKLYNVRVYTNLSRSTDIANYFRNFGMVEKRTYGGNKVYYEKNKATDSERKEIKKAAMKAKAVHPKDGIRVNEVDIRWTREDPGEELFNVYADIEDDDSIKYIPFATERGLVVQHSSEDGLTFLTKPNLTKKEAKELEKQLGKQLKDTNTPGKIRTFSSCYEGSSDYRRNFIEKKHQEDVDMIIPRCAYCHHDPIFPEKYEVKTYWDAVKFLEVDHIIPVNALMHDEKARSFARLHGITGANDMANLVFACPKCNQEKGTNWGERWWWKAHRKKTLSEILMNPFLMIVVLAIVLFLCAYFGAGDWYRSHGFM